jgi:hypothetical protein
MTEVSHAAFDHLMTLSGTERRRAEVAAIERHLDPSFYRQQHGRLLREGETPPEHFQRVGWKALLKPSADFDVWWYWANHLDPGSSEINPLVHYEYVGRHEDLSTRPDHAGPFRGHDLPRDRAVRRACLFAAYDQDGIVDDTTVSYLSELARHSDVFVLYDNYVAPSELAKLDGIAAGAWAIRHGAYDFGSYSMLARDLVGWDRLATYDEVLFVNDSCFLLKPLDEVFATMDRRSCSWWGLQATKGLASTRHQPSNAFATPIPLASVKSDLLRAFEDDPVYDFHLGSYFLAFRQPVLADERLRRLLDSVATEPSKLLIILKYEIGLTHLLLGRGYEFDTYVPTLHPFHPIFTHHYFDLLEHGFPLLKKYFLCQNHYDEPDLVDWKRRILAHVPEAPVADLEASLVRTSPADALARSFAITLESSGKVRVPRLLSGGAYRRRSAKTRKRPDLWIFAVDPVSHRLPESSRAVLHALKDNDEITKVILTRGRALSLPSPQATSAPILSEAGQQHLLEAGVVFTTGAPRASLNAPVSAEEQLIVCVRDGLSLEKTGQAAGSPLRSRITSRREGPPVVHAEPPRTISGVTAASEIDALAAVATHWPATYADAWRTGIPAHDFLFAPTEALPTEMQEQADRLGSALDGRRLLLIAPILRRSGSALAPYRFTDGDIAQLRGWSERAGYVVGVREPVTDVGRSYLTQLDKVAIDLGHGRFESTYVVLRRADAVLTDYAGLALDAAIAGTPAVSFAHDLDVARERLLYDVNHFFPGRVATTFGGVTEALTSLDEVPPHRNLVAGLLADHQDHANAERLIARVLARLEEVR